MIFRQDRGRQGPHRKDKKRVEGDAGGGGTLCGFDGMFLQKAFKEKKLFRLFSGSDGFLELAH